MDASSESGATLRVAPSIVTVTLPLCSWKEPAWAGPSGRTISLAASLPKRLGPSCSQKSPATVSHPPSALRAASRAAAPLGDFRWIVRCRKPVLTPMITKDCRTASSAVLRPIRSIAPACPRTPPTCGPRAAFSWLRSRSSRRSLSARCRQASTAMRVESALGALAAMESINSSTLAATSSTSRGSPAGQQRIRPAQDGDANGLFFGSAAFHPALSGSAASSWRSTDRSAPAVSRCGRGPVCAPPAAS